MRKAIWWPLLAAGVLGVAAEEVEDPIVAVYDLDKPLSESGREEPSMFAVEFEAERPLTFFDLSRSLALAAGDEQVEAIALELDGVPLDLSQQQEIRRHLLAAREAGKAVWLYSDQFTAKTALIGSAADRFHLNPEAQVLFNGLHAEGLYFKGMLDKAGVEADVVHIGDFKSFGEMFYREGPSEFAERQQQELVASIFGQMSVAIGEGRGIDPVEVVAVIDRGAVTPDELLASGLVDQLADRGGFNAALREAYDEDAFDRHYRLPDLDGPDMDNIFDVFKLMMSGGKGDGRDEDHVAVVVLEGPISMASVAPVRREILKLLEDEHAKALVLRVVSPGGSALASEVLWRATDQWREAERPLAVSMGGVAASGGYYVSCGADRIFAEGGTLTGSIGVVGMKFVLAGAFEKLGITSHSVQRGEHADLMSPMQPFSEEEERLVRDSMLEVYATFKARIEEGRGERLEGELEPLAGGRVYTGGRALELGLVDELGGLAEAVAWAAEQVGLGADSGRLSPEPKSPLEGLFAPPEDEEDDPEIVRLDGERSAAAASLRRMLETTPLPSLTPALAAAIEDAVGIVEAAGDSEVLLLGPAHRLFPSR